MAPSSSGPGLRVLSPAIAGSNPAGVTKVFMLVIALNHSLMKLLKYSHGRLRYKD
jgi:hypothetical protein